MSPILKECASSNIAGFFMQRIVGKYFQVEKDSWLMKIFIKVSVHSFIPCSQFVNGGVVFFPKST